MTDNKQLHMYEEIVLLALRDDQGTFSASFVEYAVAGAVLAELLLDGYISVENTKKHLVDINQSEPIGDPIVDEVFENMKSAKKRASLKTWVSRLAGIKGLQHKVARQLCNRGILRADEDKVLFLFTRKIYPEVNPLPEREILERLRLAIFGDDDQLDPRTVVLISLAHGTDLLGENLGRKQIRAQKKRITQIVNGDLVGKATKEVIEACQAAVLVAAIMPAIMASTVSAGH